MRILIVEDDPTSQMLLEDILSDYGECVIAQDGQQAMYEFTMAYASDKVFDLILMDIMMPNMDGKEAVKQMRSFESEFGINSADEARIIMITALSDPKNVFESYRGGATAYITKPVKESVLVKQIEDFGLLEKR